MKKIIFAIILGMFLIGLVGAVSIGTFKQKSNVQLYQTCNNCTYCNFTSIQYPNSSNIVTNVNTTKDGTYYSYNLYSGNTSVLGEYRYCYDCGNAVENEAGCNTFKITPSGTEDIGSGEGLSFIGSLFVMLILSLVFFFTAFKSVNVAAKVSFFSFATIFFIMTILFIVISAQQNLYGYTGLVSGVETLWFVAKVLIGIGVLSLFIIIGLVIKKAWKIKRGFD